MPANGHGYGQTTNSHSGSHHMGYQQLVSVVPYPYPPNMQPNLIQVPYLQHQGEYGNYNNVTQPQIPTSVTLSTANGSPVISVPVSMNPATYSGSMTPATYSVPVSAQNPWIAPVSGDSPWTQVEMRRN